MMVMRHCSSCDGGILPVAVMGILAPAVVMDSDGTNMVMWYWYQQQSWVARQRYWHCSQSWRF